MPPVVDCANDSEKVFASENVPLIFCNPVLTLGWELESSNIRRAEVFLAKLSGCLSKDATISQSQMLFMIGSAGSAGTDSASLADRLGMSAAAVSRTIRLLSTVSYDKSPGYGYIDFEFDPSDNRRRIVKINSLGLAAIESLARGI